MEDEVENTKEYVIGEIKRLRKKATEEELDRIWRFVRKLIK